MSTKKQLYFIHKKSDWQYYYKNSACRADTPFESTCICWHDEGTGPLPNEHRKLSRNTIQWRKRPADVDTAFREFEEWQATNSRWRSSKLDWQAWKQGWERATEYERSHGRKQLLVDLWETLKVIEKESDNPIATLRSTILMTEAADDIYAIEEATQQDHT